MPPLKKFKRTQSGFSLIEMLMVVAVIGVIAAIGAPVLHDARVSAQRSAALGSLRRLHSAQTAYRLQYNRYATMAELNSYQNGGLGQTIDSLTISKSGYTYVLVTPTAPDVSNVESGFTIRASGYTSNGSPNIYLLSADGSMQQIAPVVRDLIKF